ncbi:MAG: oligosaccharide flippase family protein [Xanthomonadales bacterium]|nr:oligosaccharide flippase family protein [Xanthomonadales bacterium]
MTSSYRQITHSTTVFGMVSLIDIVLRIIRVKFVAVILGPAGIGLLALYQSFVHMATSIAGMGMDTSAVRQLSHARGRNDQAMIAHATSAVNIAAVLLGLAGAIVIFVWRDLIAIRLLDDASRAGAVGWLAVAVFASVSGASFSTRLRGHRLIRELAAVRVATAVAATLAAVVLVYMLGQKGILPLVLAVPVAAALFGAMLARKIPVSTQALNRGAISGQMEKIFKQGFLIMLAAALMSLAVLGVLAGVNRVYGLEGAGIFQAAWAVSFVYMGFILEAMGTDYFPRLTEATESGEDVVRLINEQIHAALLMGAPLLVGMIAFAPLLVQVLYSSEFSAAARVIQWMAFGNLVKLAGWPVGFIFVAKGRNGIFLLTQIEWVVVFLLGAWIGTKHFGIEGLGMAFSAVYLFHIGLVCFFARKVVAFRFTRSNLQIFSLLLACCVLLFCLSRISVAASYITGALAIAVFSVFAYKTLKALLGHSPLARLGLGSGSG